jgi:polygalacturonase
MFYNKIAPYFFFVALIGSAMQSACSGGAKFHGNKTAVGDSVWYQQQIAAIRQQIKVPQFQDKDFLLTSFGAKGDGTSTNTEAFRKAIETCSKNGGGRVVVPEGIFLTGAIYLKSKVNLHLSENAIIRFVFDTSQYPLVFTRWEGMELMNYSPFIYAYGEKNIAITGKGILDGGATNETWLKWNGNRNFGWKDGMPKQTPDRNLLQQQNKAQVDPRQRIYGSGHYLRPQFIQPYNCKNILIEGVRLINSPMWNLNPVLCENVTIRNVHIETLGPNNDGCNPESCKNVLIKNCYFDTGDDCIAIKSGRNEDGRRIGKPSENIIIENCTMKNGHGGVVIGSEVSGGARNIFALNNKMSSPDLDRVLRIKTSSQRGGIIENIYMKDVHVGTYKEAAVHINMFYEEPGQHMPIVRNIYVENMVVDDGGKYGIYIQAYEQSPAQIITLKNCTINGVQIPVQMDHVKEVTFDKVIINGAE